MIGCVGNIEQVTIGNRSFRTVVHRAEAGADAAEAGHGH